MTAKSHKTKPAQPVKTKGGKGKPFIHITGPAAERKAPKAIPVDDSLDKYPNRKTLMQRTLNDCAWPISSAAPWFYCGERTHDGTSYCKHHSMIRRDPATPADPERATKALIRSAAYYR